MLWLTRPAILRPALAAIVVVIGFVIELMPDSMVEHPFAIDDLPAGTQVSPTDVEYRRLPEGVLPPVSVPTVIDRPVRAGEPLLPAHDSSLVPDGWWAIELEAPHDARPGTEVRLVLTRLDTDPLAVQGIVVSTGTDAYGLGSALVAVPEESADLVAQAAVSGDVTILVRR